MDANRSEPLWWLRAVIPVAVLVVLLFWIMFVFLNEGFWLARETADLPVASRHYGHGEGLQVPVVIDQSGQISFAGVGLTTQVLAAVFGKLEAEYGQNCPPIEIRAAGNTTWQNILPVLHMLRAAGLVRTSFVTRNEDGFPSSVSARIDAAPTNTMIRIVRASRVVSLNSKPCTMDRLRAVVLKLGDVDRGCFVSLAPGPDASVQDVVEILSLCYVSFHQDSVHLVDEADGGDHPNPGTLR